MVTSTQTRAKHQYADFDEYVDYQLKKTRANIKATDILTALVSVLTVVLGYLLAFVVFDQWIIPGGFGDATRLLMLAAAVLAVIAWLVWKVVTPFFKSVTALFAARTIESSEPTLQSNLLNLIDLRRAAHPVPPSVLTAMEKRAALSLSQMDVEQAVDRRSLMRASYALLAVVVLACLYTVFSPKKVSSSVWRALLPTSDVSVATRTELTDVEPGDVEVLPRTHLEVTATLQGDRPDRVVLRYTTADRHYADEPVEMRPVESGAPLYRGMITGQNGRGILQDLTYYVAAADAKTQTFHVTVIQPPSATVTEVYYEPPVYMEFQNHTQPGGHIDGWEGTNITIHATTNMPVKEATLLFSDTEDTTVKAEEIRMQVTDGTNLSAMWKLSFRADGTYPRFYRIQCRNERGDTDPEPTLYNITIHPDQPPDVDLLDPTADIERPANAVVPLLVQARDPDFLLRYLTLRIQKDGQDLNADLPIFEGRQQAYRGTYNFELAGLKLKPGDTITYWIEARDNKQPLSNRRNTPRLKIQITEPVSEEQVQQQLQEDERYQQELQQEAQQQEDPQQSDQQGAGKGEPQESPAEETDPSPAQPDEKTDAESDGQDMDEQQTGEGSKGAEQSDGSEDAQEQSGDTGQQKKLETDGSDDSEAIRKLMEREQDQQPPTEDGSPPQDTGTEPSDGGQDEEKSESNDHPSDSKDSGGQDGQPSEAPSTPDMSAGADEDPMAPAGDEEGPDDGNRSQDNGQQQAGTKSEPTDGSPSDADPSSDTEPPSSNGSGTPSDTEKPGSDQADTSKATPESTGKSDESVSDATPEKATGDETGTGTPDKNPNAPPKPADNEIERKQGTEPVTRPSDDRSPSGTADQKSQDDTQKPKPDDATTSSQQTEKEPSDGSPPDQKPTSAKPSPDQPKPPLDEQPDMGKTPPSGDTNQQDPQSPQADGEQAGDQNGQDKTEGENEGAGAPDAKPNDAEPSQQQKSGGKGQPGAGGKQNGQPKSDGQSSPSGSQPTDKPGSKSGAGSSNQPGSETRQGPQSGAPGGQQSGDAPGGAMESRDGQNAQGASGSASGSASDAEAANLEYTKQAVDLVLKRLEDELERGDVDQELLEELGWTETDLRRFAERLQRQLGDRGEDVSPHSLARRRQFEEMLKSLGVQSKTARRSGTDAPTRPTEGIGPRRMPVPAEVRELYEAYTKALSKRTADTPPARP